MTVAISDDTLARIRYTTLKDATIPDLTHLGSSAAAAAVYVVRRAGADSLWTTNRSEPL
ncbi:hypothetical protein IWX88_001053 [Frigoribacterium sp. CG_9.8]|nr:hypothetical protein [Frigoribacterium sp. CG_9.8]